MATITGFAKNNQVTRINEREMARMFYAAGATGAVFTPDAFKVVAIGGSRRVSIATGALSACGVEVARQGIADAITIDIPTPKSGKGQWNLQVARLDWGQGTVTYPTLTSIDTPDAKTIETMPPRPPFAYPPTLRRDPGIVYDVPLAWIWASYAVASLRVFDLRVLPDKTPASLASDGIFRWVRTGNEFDLIGAGRSGQLLGNYGANELPRGVYQYEGIAIVQTVDDGATTISDSWIDIDGEVFARHRNDQSRAAREITEVRTFKHPGGLLQTNWQAEPERQTIKVLRDGTEASLSWQRLLT